jgi:23S rRNA (adenine2503-C2)-methyltransferase
MLYMTPPEDLADHLPDEPAYRARQLEKWLYRTPVLQTADMTDLAKPLRTALADDLWPFDVATEQVADHGTTRKWLFRTKAGTSIESVLMGYPKRTTVCISSQAGCAMGCTFCATGQFGFERHLEPGEIVAQVAYAAANLRERPIAGSPTNLNNVVFMGMGEPLSNYRRLREALRRLIEVMGLSPRSITVSTVGVVPGIRRLAEEPWPLNLAISLHASEDARRSSLVPLNDRYPIAQLIDAARYYFERKGRRISLEWTLIAGKNDDTAEALRLATIARNMHAHINVIAMNPTPLTSDRPPSAENVRRFISTLRNAGANATLRDTRGSDIDGACGQLRVREAEVPLPMPGTSSGSLAPLSKES